MKMIIKFGGVADEKSKEERFSFLTGSGTRISDYRMNFNSKEITIFCKPPDEVKKEDFVLFLQSHKDFIEAKS